MRISFEILLHAINCEFFEFFRMANLFLVRDFVLLLKTQSVKCNYGEQLQMQLRDRLIAGINIPELKQKLLLMVDPTFQNVRQVCEQYEDVLHASSTQNIILFNSSTNSNTTIMLIQQFMLAASKSVCCLYQ